MKSPVHRRTFLRASGVSMALPWLESMQPAIAKATPELPRRIIAVCTTLGIHSPALWPETVGARYESTEYLSVLNEHREEFTLFSGLAHEGQAGRQPHNCEMTWLTAAQGPGMDGFRNTVSVDQHAAKVLGRGTRFPSITLGSNTSQSQSYTEGGVMIPAETRPSQLFARLFLRGDARDIAKQKQMLREGVSILDQLQSQRLTLRRVSSAGDNRQLDEYFESVRKAERDLSEARGWLDRPKPSVAEEPPLDIDDGADLVGRVQLMMGLIPLILQTDSSRVVTFMIQDHKTVPRVAGVTGEHHSLSHHGQEQSKIEQLKKIERPLIQCFAELLTRLKNKREGGQRLLDQASILFGSNLGNANAHDSTNLPIFLAGGGYRHGRYVVAGNGKDVPLSNLFLTMLRHSGVEAETFAQSTSALEW